MLLTAILLIVTVCSMILIYAEGVHRDRLLSVAIFAIVVYVALFLRLRHLGRLVKKHDAERGP